MIIETGMTSQSSSVRSANRAALDKMDRHQAAARKSLKAGDGGLDYFHGLCVVDSLDEDDVVLRNAAGETFRKIRAYWLGLL